MYVLSQIGKARERHSGRHSHFSSHTAFAVGASLAVSVGRARVGDTLAGRAFKAAVHTFHIAGVRTFHTLYMQTLNNALIERQKRFSSHTAFAVGTALAVPTGRARVGDTLAGRALEAGVAALSAQRVVVNAAGRGVRRIAFCARRAVDRALCIRKGG